MAVKATGQFDSDFMKLMIPHHEAALEMAKAELSCGKDPAARRLAQEIIAATRQVPKACQFIFARTILLPLYPRNHDRSHHSFGIYVSATPRLRDT